MQCFNENLRIYNIDFRVGYRKDAMVTNHTDVVLKIVGVEGWILQGIACGGVLDSRFEK